ncbi:MAG: hypothetical protein IJY39_13535 [Clostridia bacterium]|nr:hypothetical protein [Clostridia bacterium]
MKTVLFKKWFALAIALVMIAGTLLLPVTAAEEVTEEAEPYVVFWAEDMQDKLDGLNPISEYSVTEADGFTVLDLGIKAGASGGDPYVAFTPDQTYSTEDYKFITLVVKTNVQADYSAFSIYYGTDGTGGTFVGGGRVPAVYTDMQGWQILSFDFTDSEKWTGELSKVRFDYFEGSTFTENDHCQVLAMVLSTTAAAAYDAANEIAYMLYPPVQSFSDFTDADIASVGSDVVKTTVAAAGGNLMYMATGDLKDPSAWFYYGKITAARKMETLTTNDFRYTVIRYRSSMNLANTRMQLFVLTGDAKSLMDMIRTKNTYDCHYGITGYVPSRTYKSVVVDLAYTDGQEQNTQLMYGWQGREVFTGFRFDWCDAGTYGAYLEVSDFLFYADKEAADGYSALINSMSLIDADTYEEEETYETEHVVMPWETESATDETEETLPEYTEDTTEVVTEITSEDDSESSSDVVEDETETGSVNTGDNTGNQTNPDGNIGGDVGGIDISGGDEPPVDQGSETPFLIACITLAGLSVASIVTVIVIRIKER